VLVAEDEDAVRQIIEKALQAVATASWSDDGPRPSPWHGHPGVTCCDRRGDASDMNGRVLSPTPDAGGPTIKTL